MQIYLKTVK